MLLVAVARPPLTAMQQVATSVGTDLYIHTYRPTTTCRAIFHERRISSVTFVVCIPIRKSASRWLAVVADSSDYGLLGEQSSPKWQIPCPGRP